MRILLWACAPLLATGCVHTQLRHSTVNQSATISDIYEQQVMNNLAKFAVNPHATPDFSVASSGRATVSDSGDLNAAAPLNPFFKILGLDYSRASESTWALKPISDPNRLALMRCAYQTAVGFSDGCEECANAVQLWYGPQLCSNVQPCCFKSGKRCDVPNDCCVPVGEYCGTYVWIPCGCEASFGRLVQQVIDYAEGTAAAVPELPTKQVTLFVDEDGHLVKEENAAEVIVVNAPLDSPRSELLKVLGFTNKKDTDGKDVPTESIDPDAVELPNPSDIEINKILQKYSRSGSTSQPSMIIVPPGSAPTAQDQRIQFDVLAPPTRSLRDR